MAKESNKKYFIPILIALILVLVLIASAFSDSNFLAKLANPYVNTLILTVATVLIVIELFLPTYGIAGIVGILLYGIYFASNIQAGYSDWMSVIVFLLGMLLIGFESVIPGFGVIGVSGIILVVIGVILGRGNPVQAIISLSIAAISGFGSVFILIKTGFNSKLFDKIILRDKQTDEKGFVSSNDYSHLLGKTGIAITNLRPAGFVEIDGQKIDSVSEGPMIDSGEKIEVVSVEGFSVKVRRL